MRVLLSICLSAGLLVACKREVEDPVPPPQVQSYSYYDLNPDSTYTSFRAYGALGRVPQDSVASASFDIDQDGDLDIRINTSHGVVYIPPMNRECEYGGMEAIDTNFRFMNDPQGYWNDFEILDSGDVIPTSGFAWTNWGWYYRHRPGNLPPGGSTELGTIYIGVCKKVSQGSSLYGWIRVNRINSVTVRVEEWALGTVPNSPAVAGDH